MRRAATNRLERRLLDGEFESRCESDGAQSSQTVLTHAGGGIADRAHDLPLQVALPMERIAQLLRGGRERDRVDREVAARQVLVERRAELDLGVAAVRL